MSAEQTNSDAYYTKTPSVVVLKLVEHPVSLLILQYILIRKKIYKKFRINDIANMLKKDDRTIREHLKPLVKLELLNLMGEIGSQYYEFNVAKYNAYMRVNPFKVTSDPSQKMGDVPSQETGGEGVSKNGSSPLPKNGSVKIKEEIKEEIKEIDERKDSAGNKSIGNPISFEDLEKEFQSQPQDPLIKAIKIQKPTVKKMTGGWDGLFGFNPEA
jgi:DNA-binding transcriptional ArsR family regulator